MNSADRIKTPLLVVHGVNDVIVNKRESDQTVIALRDRGLPVEYLVVPDEGHGLRRPVNNMASFMAAEKFLAKHLDGRYQERGSPEVVKRLAEITVDPKTVMLAVKLDAASVGVPRPVVDPRPSVSKYQVTVSLGGQKLKLALTAAVKEEDGGWAAAWDIPSPLGAIHDRATLEKGTLVQRSRRTGQPGMKVSIAYTGSNAAGTQETNGQEKPVAADTGGPVFADGPGSAESIACLPLAEGYSATLRNFDPQRMKTRPMQLTVAGVESIAGPAGTFDTFRVETAAGDGGIDRMTYWIEKETRRPVRIRMVLASLGGAELTAELLP